MARLEECHGSCGLFFCCVWSHPVRANQEWKIDVLLWCRPGMRNAGPWECAAPRLYQRFFTIKRFVWELDYLLLSGKGISFAGFQFRHHVFLSYVSNLLSLEYNCVIG